MRPMPSASAMSVTVAPEASAFAIRARRPSRRSSAVDAGLTGASMAGVFRFCMHARWDEPPRIGRYTA